MGGNQHQRRRAPFCKSIRVRSKAKQLTGPRPPLKLTAALVVGRHSLSRLRRRKRIRRRTRRTRRRRRKLPATYRRRQSAARRKGVVIESTTQTAQNAQQSEPRTCHTDRNHANQEQEALLASRHSHSARRRPNTMSLWMKMTVR